MLFLDSPLFNYETASFIVIAVMAAKTLGGGAKTPAPGRKIGLKDLFHPAGLVRVVSWLAFAVVIFSGDKQRPTKGPQVQE